MRRFATVAPLFVLTTCVLPTIALTLCVPSSAHADPRDLVTETLFLTYMQPSSFTKLLKVGSEDLSGKLQKTLLPTGISEITPDDMNNTVLLRGTAAAITEVKKMVALLDVKPRVIEIKLRLIEIQRSADGTLRESTVLAPILSSKNNSPASITLEDSSKTVHIDLTPHINGDDSVSLKTELQMKQVSLGNPVTVHQVTTMKYRRLSTGEWHPLFTVTLSQSKTIPDYKYDTPVDALAKIPEAYPLYRLEVFTARKTDSPQR